MQDLQFEESRQIWLDTKAVADQTVEKLNDLIDKYEKPHQIQEVSGELHVNTETSLEITNFISLKTYFDNLSTEISNAIKDNSHKPLSEIKIANFPEFPKNLDIKNASAIYTPIINAIKDVNVQPVVNVAKQDVKFPTNPKDAIAVRLSDGKRFYTALAAVTSAVQSIPTVRSATTEVNVVAVANPDGTAINDDIDYSTRLDDTSTVNTIYIGKAPVGSSESSAVWQIAKLDTSSGLKKTWSGNAGFTQVWTDRTSLTYS